MEQQEQLLLEPLLNEINITRRSLLPIWIKVFIWIFMIIGALAPLGFVAGLFGANMEESLYGLESHEPLSGVGILIILLIIIKGIVAYSLWTEKDWAINLGIADAIIGIGICTYLMVIAPFVNNQSGFVMNFRLELVALIPYLIKLQKIKTQWLRAKCS
jgi:hypothetical protein